MAGALLATLAVTLTVMAGLWLVSLPLRNASLVDIFWSLGFVNIAWISQIVTGTDSARAWLACALVTVWGVRLAAYLAARNVGKGEDYRYRAMRERYGSRFPLVSLGLVFLLQGVLIWIVSLPIQAVQVYGVDRPLGWLDAAGVVLWCVGFGFEAVGDAQLARFKREPGSRGRVMDRGLWRYTRHPNYFGDFLLWWGFGLMALATGAWWALVGPLVMTVLLLEISGVRLLESTISERRPGYREYARRTSAFIPWFPQGD